MLKITIAGRPNTGKSTLFNALTGTRDALVHDRPGVTRDTRRKAGVRDDVETLSALKSLDAIEKSDVVILVVDGRVGLTHADTEWARMVRRKTRAPVLLLVNKSESGRRMADTHEFYKLGFGEPIMISAEHKSGFDAIYEFMDKIAGDTESSHDASASEKKLKIAILGQPNVGKSTLVNRVLGQTRQIVMDAPGITRDTVKIPTNFYGRDIILMDTAGLRRKAGVRDDVETLSGARRAYAMMLKHCRH